MVESDTKIKLFSDVQKELCILFAQKNDDYGDAQLIEFDELGILIRVNDKVERLKNIHKKGGMEVKDETIEDTWRDIAVYSVIAILLLMGKYPGSKEAKKCAE